MTWPEFAIALLAAVVPALIVHFRWRGRFAAQVGSIRDQMEALKAEHRGSTHRLETRQEALFNSMPDGLLILDHDGRISLANRACHALFGFGTDIRGRTMMEALRLHEISPMLARLGPDQKVLERELRITQPAERWLQVSAAAVFDGTGDRRGTVLVFHDLTRIKFLENARKEFVANVSHELRTPLSLINGYVETLVDGAYQDPELCLKFLKTIERNGTRLRLLIEDLLVLSEIESGRVTLSLQSTVLSATVRKVLEDFGGAASARSIRLHDQCPDLLVRADPGRLEQVLGNLVDNAIKYGAAGGTVTVGALASAAGTVEVFVRDNGPGIPSEALDRIFERFYRIDKARSRDQGGTGLGLSIVKHLVQSHGGRAWAESELGKGATFRFTLPAGEQTSGSKKEQAGTP